MLKFFNASALGNFFVYLFTHIIFAGIGAKIISCSLLTFGFWLLIRRENFVGFLVCMFFSFLFAYFGGLLGLLV